MGKLINLLVTIVPVVAIITGEASANGHEDGNSITEMASFMKENFRELFQRLDRLESKVSKIIGKENCPPAEMWSGGGEIQDKDSPDTFNDTGPVVTPGSHESRIEASAREVNRLHRIISEREYFCQIMMKFI